MYVMPKDLSNETLLENLKAFAKEIGETPSANQMTDHGPHAVNSYSRTFGSWNSALEMAGLDKNHVQSDYSDSGWNNEETLRALYWGNGMSTYEIAEHVSDDVNASIVFGKLEKYDIERRTNGENKKDSKHLSKEWLEKMYCDKKKSTLEIAECADVTDSTVVWHMRKHGIDRREKLNHKRGAPKLKMRGGYEAFRSQWGGEYKTVRVHQLLAIAGGENPKEVFDSKMVVHHKNGIKWDNRRENLEVMTISDHMSLHRKRGD